MFMITVEKPGEDKLKTLAITSTSPQEGKTTVSINLAIAMAQAGQKTLLVGSDLRKPMMAKVFGLEIIPGLTDILLGNYPWRDTVKTITDMIMGNSFWIGVMILTVLIMIFGQKPIGHSMATGLILNLKMLLFKMVC